MRILIFILTMIIMSVNAQVRLSYVGNNDNIKSTITAINEILSSGEFYRKIVSCKDFYGTKMTPSMVANCIWGYDTTITIESYTKHNPFSSKVEYTKISKPNLISINTYDFTGKIERRVSILMKEVIKAIDLISDKAEFTCDDNDPNKYNSVPYILSDIAENMVRYGFGYEDDPKIKEKWYLPHDNK